MWTRLFKFFFVVSNLEISNRGEKDAGTAGMLNAEGCVFAQCGTGMYVRKKYKHFFAR
jgi:hypothetical protein